MGGEGEGRMKLEQPHATPHSLFFEKNFLLGLQKFPVPLRNFAASH